MRAKMPDTPTGENTHEESPSRRRRIEALRRQVESLPGYGCSYVSPECPPEIEERFWRSVLEMEREENAARDSPAGRQRDRRRKC